MTSRLLWNEETMYQALVNKESSFEGIFYAAIKTTGIFCRPTCTARKPKRENTEFFSTTKEALLHGYRPCKICNPLGIKGEVPKWLKPVFDKIEKEEDTKITDQKLREMGLDPNRVRRWFKKYHNLTFQAFLRTQKITRAFGRIRHGEKVINAAFESGYESLSGFTESFKKATGFSPNKSTDQPLVIVTRILSPLGPMLAGATDQGICLLEFMDRKMLPTQLQRIKRIFKAELVPGTSPYFSILDKQVGNYFAGELKQFTVPLDFSGTLFQQQVWQALLDIPYGQTRSYLEQARAIGNAKAIRAVARANGDNRISLIIPCHRVIGSDGNLVGYGGGLWRKKYLLDLEYKNI